MSCIAITPWINDERKIFEESLSVDAKGEYI